MGKWRKFVPLTTLAGLAALLGVIAVLGMIPKGPAVTLTTIMRLRPKMSEAEVAAVLGPPAADRTRQPPTGVPPPPDGGRLLEYVGDRATTLVEFDAHGQIVCVRPEIRTVSGLERVLLRLNWW
jgi:hypothetical protein